MLNMKRGKQYWRLTNWMSFILELSFMEALYGAATAKE